MDSINTDGPKMAPMSADQSERVFLRTIDCPTLLIEGSGTNGFLDYVFNFIFWNLHLHFIANMLKLVSADSERIKLIVRFY